MACRLFARPRACAYVFDADSVWTYVSYAFMILASLLRLFYFLRVPQPAETYFVHLVMPLAASALFVCAIVFLGERTALPSAAGVILGVAFFALKAQAFTPVHQTLCTILYLTVAVLYTASVTGVVPTKKLLYPLFGLPLLYHIFVEDTQYYFFADPPVPVIEWLPEISVLCIMGALLALSFALHKKESK